MKTYYQAPKEIIEMANKLIIESDDLSDIKEFVPNIKFLFDDRKEDAEIKSECKKVTGLLKYFAKTDFIILISQQLYNDTNIKDMVAILHHELRHICVKRDKNDKVKTNKTTGEVDFAIRPHDVEKFIGIDDE